MLEIIELDKEICEKKRIFNEICKIMKKNKYIVKENYLNSSFSDIFGYEIYKKRKKIMSWVRDDRFICEFFFNKKTFEVKFPDISKKIYPEVFEICNLLKYIDGIKIKLHKDFCGEPNDS
jgi:hypothetical protein